MKKNTLIREEIVYADSNEGICFWILEHVIGKSLILCIPFYDHIHSLSEKCTVSIIQSQPKLRAVTFKSLDVHLTFEFIRFFLNFSYAKFSKHDKLTKFFFKMILIS